MNPSELDPDDVNPIADQNTERLLAGAYRPEMPDPAFLAQVTAAMHAVAGEAVKSAQPDPVFRVRTIERTPIKHWIGWVAAAGLLLALGMVAGAMLRARAEVQRNREEVSIGGKTDRETEATQKDATGTVTVQQTAAVTATLQQTGMVALQQAGKATPAAEVLQVGRSAETGSDQRRRLALADGSILYLNRDTAVTLTAPREVTLRRGEIYVEVAQDPAAARFIVNTPRKDIGPTGERQGNVSPDKPTYARQMIALGTKFDVRVAPEGTELLVTQGKVQVSDVQLPVLAGQQLVVDGAAAAPPDASPAPRATHAIEWTRELMAAAHSPLVPGNRYSGGSLVAVDPQGQETRLSLRKYHVDVHIEDGFARTTIDQTYFNQSSPRLEGTFYFPLPADASLSRLAMYVNGRLMEGGMAERQHAREVFDSIVTRMKDPALLEWVDGSTFKMRVFPLEGRQEKRIILSYTQRLPSLYGRSEYRFPGGHSLPVIGDWSVHVRVKNGAGLQWQGEPQLTANKLAGDLLLDSAARDIRPDRDIVVSMISDFKSTTSNSCLFSSAICEGSKYVMLRWQPDLPGEKVRQRRDWIFLFESSGDRNPLLARAQVEIVKTILENAEHDDTFSILTAATRVHTYQTRPQTATPANVKQAVRFLENVHLIGALDLGRAFEAARPLAAAAQNPVLVHVGSGLPVLGLRDVETLIKRVPDRTAYVGIGVGNRWSRALMKSAAARSGGYFTQINPDEQIAWRALDLLATLNTPRLLGVQVRQAFQPDFLTPGQPGKADVLISQAGKPNLQFLTCEDSLVQGEQLCAIARLDAADEMPKTLEVTGQLNGKPRKWTLSVAGLAEKADYLPRTWAKLEIDRLVADGAEKNKARIVDLSKAMYVMSPFTSLLVLENEEMYAQYHVDRGRKDHWAMYACPEKIPVVNEPLVGPANPSSKTEEKGPTAEEVLSTVMVRVPPAILGRAGGRPSGIWTVPIVDWAASLWDSDLGNGGRAAQEIGPANVVEEQWQKDVQNTINEARKQVNVDPAAAESTIRHKQQDLAAVSEMRPEMRDCMTNMLSAALREIKHRGEEFIFRQQAIQREAAAQTEVELPASALPMDGYKLAQLFERYDSLMAEGRHRLEVESAVERNETVRFVPLHANAAAIEKALAAFTGETISAETLSEFMARQNEIIANRAERQRAFVNALYRAEMSSNPYDDPPIIYPDAETWRELTRRRKGMYGGTSVYPVADLVLPDRRPDFGNPSRILNPVRMEVIQGLDLLVLRGSPQDLERIWSIVDQNSSLGTQADPPIVFPNAEVWRELTARHAGKYGAMALSRPTPTERKIDEALKEPTQIEFVETPFRDVIDYLKDLHHIEIQLDSADLREAGVDENMPITKSLKGISLRSALKLMLDDFRLTYVIHDEVLLITTPEKAESEEFLGYGSDSADMLRWILLGFNRKVPTYEAPQFSSNPAVFYDLVSYAPAMHTNLADVLAVLEAEVPTSASAAKPGKIADRARRLIERARGAGWQSATIADPHGKTLTIAFDGTGRYRYERTTSKGLREQIVCDGTSLWQLYPELGVGARRTLSRFHRQDFARLVPWALPAAEDLAHDADLVCIDERTVAIVPHQNLPSPVRGRGAGGEGGLHSSVPSLHTHLVFVPDGRLAERQLVEMPSGKIKIRESYGADGTVEYVADERKNAGGTPTLQKVNAGGPPTLRRKIVLAPCGAPELKPDPALVVLPLPLRGRAQVFGARKLLADQAYSNWSEEDALAVIAADLGENPSEMDQIIGQRFFRRGDRRLGFYTLLLSTGQAWNPKENLPQQKGGDPLPVGPLADHPNDPLAKYVAAYLASSRPGGPKDFGDPAQSGTHDSGFLRQLAEFHDLWDRWHDGRATGGTEAQQRQECQRALVFINGAQSPELAWGLLMAVRQAINGFELHSGFAGASQRFESIAAAIPRFETVPGLEYAARYERARALLDTHGGTQARDLFHKLFTTTLEAGIVPPIDSSFREALVQGGNGQQWQETIRAAAKKLIDAGARPSAVYLARQVQQVGDPPLAEEVFDMALRNAPESQRLGLTLARIAHCRQTGQLPRADALLQSLIADKRYGGSPALWYLAEAIAEARGMTARAIGFHERAMEIEFEQLPEKVNVEVIRNDYGQLLARYEKLATAIGPLQDAAPGKLLAEVIRTADRWRQLDSDPTAACQAAARILGQMGEIDLAWDYLTTPLSVQPSEPAGWANLALALRQQGLVDLADRAYAAAFDSEPTNAQILWDRAESLRENGRADQARPLFRQIAAGSWGPQFARLQSQAKEHVGK